MNSELQLQTDQILKAFTVLHNDLGAIYLTLVIGIPVVVALLLIIAFKRRRD